MFTTSALRYPQNFYQRVLTQFRHPQNIKYLRTLFNQSGHNFVENDVYEYARNDLIQSSDLWNEVNRLNCAFYKDKVISTNRTKKLYSFGKFDDESEPYHVRAFTADSLRPEENIINIDDDSWDDGNATRTPEQALAEYWGEDYVESSSFTPKEHAQADRSVWSENWRKNNNTRFMRREGIPIWQRGGYRNHEYNIDETLGTATHEMGTHVRRWTTPYANE
jgi:hypothetical protein